jgi:hypothetical protein
VASVCYTDGMRHNCQQGATCDATGACVFASDGMACMFDVDCGSKHCWRAPGVSMSAPGLCCNQACNNECQNCGVANQPSAGVCVARTGADCSFGVSCSTTVKGFSSSAPNRCQAYPTDRNGVCLASGMCGNSVMLCANQTGVDLTVCAASQCAGGRGVIARVR